MATYLLVHGGGHGGWCYNKLSPLLKAAGHGVYAPSLAGWRIANISHMWVST